jgi:indolepyruvate ferredoxin oxidoreductase beta subunit
MTNDLITSDLVSSDQEGVSGMSEESTDKKLGSCFGSKVLNSELRTPNSEPRMQIAITGRGGQGVLFITRILSECALELGLNVIASETHGMAMRGGSVISTLKVGDYRGPLIGSGQAGIMLVLDAGSMEAFSHLLAEKGTLFLNAPSSDSYPCIDATGLAAGMGNPVIANLVLLGFALSRGTLFCDYALVERVTERLSPPRFREINLKALKEGFSANAGKEQR